MTKHHKISDHFSTRDISCLCGIGTDEYKCSLGLIGGLELLRSKLDTRINIVKGYVCQDCAEKNKAVKKNFHTMGLAVDIRADGKTPEEIFKVAEEIPEFKGIGLNIKEKYIHVDTRKVPDRLLWVETGTEKIDLTPENREKYLGK